MSVQITIEYLSKLLNKPITENVQIALSSAQKSRVHGWLTKNNIAFHEAILAKKFTVLELIGCSSEVLGNSSVKFKKHALVDNFIEVSESLIGIDIQQIDELFPNGLPVDPKVDEGLNQIFTLKELSYAQSKEDPKQTLTGIFCAKEAIQKISNQFNDLSEIEILVDDGGRPISDGFSISISHSGSYAMAAALRAERNERPISFNLDRPIDGEMLKLSEGASIDYSQTPDLQKIISFNKLRVIDYVYFIVISILGYMVIVK